jgi:(R,R)-butanediol dehydrogenase/meso-butanediol dehydrogenase/diacetyl reductase
MGADAAVDPQKEDPARVIQSLSGAAPDVVFECIGVPGTIAESLNYVRRGGRVVVIGACMENDQFAPMAALNKEIDLRFSLGLEPGEIETAIAMLAAGRVNTAPMITDVIGLDQLPKAFAELSAPNRQTKVMVEF